MEQRKEELAALLSLENGKTYREALRGWRALGLAFDEALTVLDIAILLDPTDREMPEAADALHAARETLTRLGADPFLARLDAARVPRPTEAIGARPEAADAVSLPS